MKKNLRKILIIVNFQNFNVAAATIVCCILVHAAFLTFITILFNEAPGNCFAHTSLNVNSSAGRGSQVCKG
ncbi:MAG TPA: hypothetical protein VLI68_11305 [Hanamia sp.]|nr:hypothetical protein [Hanamia sp.]